MRVVLLLVAVLLAVCATPARADRQASARLEDLDARIEADPDDIELRILRADVRFEADRHHEALADLAVVAERSPDEPRVFLLRALINEELGWLDLAEADLDRYLAVAEPSARALGARGRIREASGRLVDARSDYAGEVALMPTPEAVLALGRTCEGLGDLDAAAVAYREGAVRLGGAVVLRLAAVRVERARHQPELALAQVDLLLVQAPDHPDWLALKADVLDDAGARWAAHAQRRVALLMLDERLRRRPTQQRRAARAALVEAMRGLP